MGLLVAIWREWIREVEATEPGSTILLDPHADTPAVSDKERNVG